MQTFLRLLTPVVYLFFFVVSFLLQQPERQVVKVSQCLTSCRLSRVIASLNLLTTVPSPHSSYPFFVSRVSSKFAILLYQKYHGSCNIPCVFSRSFPFLIFHETSLLCLSYIPYIPISRCICESNLEMKQPCVSQEH